MASQIGLGLRTAGAVGLLGLTLAAATLVAQRPGGVTFEDLRQGLKDPTRWLTFSGDYSGQRHSPLTQITPENVKQLAAQWTFQTELRRGEVRDHAASCWTVCSTSPAPTTAWALDARDRPPIWRYRRELPDPV